MKILMEETDELHPLTIKELVAKLDQYNIQAERKSLYNDIENLRSFGIDIEKNNARAYAYYVASRSFELPELKLLVDAVQSSKFITHKFFRFAVSDVFSDQSQAFSGAVCKDACLRAPAKRFDPQISCPGKQIQHTAAPDLLHQNTE